MSKVPKRRIRPDIGHTNPPASSGPGSRKSRGCFCPVGTRTEIAETESRGRSPHARPPALFRSHRTTPSPDDVESFVRDTAPNRYERLVDRLLASPAMGNAGTPLAGRRPLHREPGFEYDRPRDNAWPYRDHVIRSFNADKPYDRFMRGAGRRRRPWNPSPPRESLASLLVSGPGIRPGIPRPMPPSAPSPARRKWTTRWRGGPNLSRADDQLCAVSRPQVRSDPLVDYYRVKAVFGRREARGASCRGSREIAARIERRARAQQVLSAAVARVAAIESEAARAALGATSSSSNILAPIPVANWTFEDPSATGTRHRLRRCGDLGSRLSLPTPGAYFESEPITSDLREKTLRPGFRWRISATGGGAAISLERKDGAL